MTNLRNANVYMIITTTVESSSYTWKGAVLPHVAETFDLSSYAPKDVDLLLHHMPKTLVDARPEQWCWRSACAPSWGFKTQKDCPTRSIQIVTKPETYCLEKKWWILFEPCCTKKNSISFYSRSFGTDVIFSFLPSRGSFSIDKPSSDSWCLL